VGTGVSTPRFDGFHLARLPKILQPDGREEPDA
jgi:hypothetical protein